MTLGVRELGVLATADRRDRARRAATLSIARQAEPLPVTEAVMSEWAQLVHACRRAGIHRVLRLTDAVIAATAIAHGVPVVTQDDDFSRVAEAHLALQVIRV